MDEYISMMENARERLSPELYAELARLLLAHVSEGVYFVSPDHKILLWNRFAEQISGYREEEVLGHCCADNLLRHIDSEGTELCLHGCPLAATIRDGALREADVYLHHKAGHRVPVQVRTIPVRNAAGVVLGALELFSDRSDQQVMLRQLEALRDETLTDALTGVGNRKYGDRVLRERFRQLQEERVPFGFLMIDIDHFKDVNDRHGHAVGDRVLTMVAGSLGSALRRMDVLWRWGGEEFAAVFPGANREELAAIAERLRLFVEKSWLDHEDGQLRVRVSVGGTLALPEDTPDTLFQRADRLLYRSKQEGRNRVTLD